MNFVVPAAVLIPLTAGFFNFRFLDKEFKILCYYLMSSFMVNVITTVCSYHHIPNLFFFHLYTPIEAVFLFLFFQEVFADTIIVKVIWFLIIAFPLYCIINFIFFQDSGMFNTYTHPVEALLFIGLCIYYFWCQSLGHGLENKWTGVPLNWIVSGLLLYFSSTFFLYVFSNVLIHNYSKATNIFIWNVHGIIIVVTNLFWTIGFYKCRK